MPNLNDIATIADSLEKHSVGVVPDRCVRVRNRNAKCTKCLDVCKVKALTIEQNKVEYNASACVHCGACVTVCPTEALVALDPPESALAQTLAQTRSHTGGIVALACARQAAKRKGDPACFAEVPCLGRVDESLFLSIASSHPDQVLLVDGQCSSCRFGWCEGVIESVTSDVNGILENLGSPLRIQRVSEFPEALLITDEAGTFGASRRNFFTDSVGYMKDATMTAAKATLNEKLGGPKKETRIGERLRVNENGTLPQFPMARHERAIDAIDALGTPQGETLDSSLFGAVTIETDTCNACGMCVTFCPSGALSRRLGDDPGKKLTAIEFLACDCVQCDLCSDVCWKDSCTVSRAVPTDQLFDFEPVVFTLNPAG